jgi:hypothetical protein
MTIRYAAAIAAILCATAFPAFAGPFYQLVGGICNDGSGDGNGQLLCSDNIAATVEMADGYVPGTPFADSTQGLPVTVAFFTFSDGFVTIATDFPLGASGPGNFGVMPDTSGQGALHIHWFQGFFFDAENGIWHFGQEFGPGGGGGQGYFSSGTYGNWVRVIPEPGLLSLAGVALAMLALVRSRRSRARIRA